jgi:hypothetical protein
MGLSLSAAAQTLMDDDEIAALTKKKQLLTLRNEVRALEKEQEIATNKTIQDAQTQAAVNNAVSALIASDAAADAAKITALSTLVSEKKAGKEGAVTIGAEGMTVVPIGGALDDEVFTRMASTICRNSMEAGGALVVAPTASAQGAVLTNTFFKELRRSNEESRSLTISGESLLVDILSFRKKDTQKGAKSNGAALKGTKGLPAVLSAISLLPNIANSVADLTKVFRADVSLSLRDSSDGTDFLLGKIATSGDCKNVRLLGDERQTADYAVQIVRARNEQELLISELTTLSSTIQSNATDPVFAASEAESLRQDMATYVSRVSNTLAKLRQLGAALDLESTKRGDFLQAMARKVMIGEAVDGQQTALLLVDAQRITTGVKSTQTFRSEKIGKVVALTAMMRLYAPDGRLVQQKAFSEGGSKRLDYLLD